MLKYGIIVCAIALTACSPVSAPKTTTREITGTATQRVSDVSAILTKHKAPPSAILDAHFVEEQIGDGNFGPSDFRAFYILEVAPQDIPKWMQILTPLTNKPEYNALTESKNWWIARDVFPSLEFYKPEALTGRMHGWIGISRQTGRIYIFTFTM
ncbi:hypothetical protein V2H45_15225 [Tumidithrix elongata RA019]|uniref:Lipoprotein n=1 Tax=Tumidithrix elongata BACA0141 TaxID=2716417 RepID=A0AAW9Q3V3_9CYAN|nr:hypothetical protein [Tumidithrix elongata RA019]